MYLEESIKHISKLLGLLEATIDPDSRIRESTDWKLFVCAILIE